MSQSRTTLPAGRRRPSATTAAGLAAERKALDARQTERARAAAVTLDERVHHSQRKGASL